MAMRTRWAVAVIGGAVILAGAAYLRDPPWILSMTSGMRAWETDPAGGRFRWTEGHASFFVPSDARAVEIPLRTTFDGGNEWPITAVITVDDRPADRITLRDPAWHSSIVRLPARGTRRARRIDIRLDRTRADNHGVQVGEVVVRF
jgi:hypothetical protein